MLDWHSCQICYPLEIKLKLLFASHNDKLTYMSFFFFFFFFFFVVDVFFFVCFFCVFFLFCFFFVPLVFCDPPTLFKVFRARSINLYIYAFPGQPPRQYITSWCSFFRQ